MSEDVKKLRQMVDGLPKNLDEFDINDIRIAGTIVDQWLAEHQADDGVAIDESWLRSVGYAAVGVSWYADYEGAWPIVFWNSTTRCLHIAGLDIWKIENATRGQFRRLHAALCIPLKGNP